MAPLSSGDSDSAWVFLERATSLELLSLFLVGLSLFVENPKWSSVAPLAPDPFLVLSPTPQKGKRQEPTATGSVLPLLRSISARGNHLSQGLSMHLVLLDGKVWLGAFDYCASGYALCLYVFCSWPLWLSALWRAFLVCCALGAFVWLIRVRDLVLPVWLFTGSSSYARF
ncbi:hypothetical protein V6N13_032442 [Hibiscus sabdariffa]